MKKLFTTAIVALILGAGAYFGYQALSNDIKIEFTAEELQAKIDEQFPRKKQKFLFTIEMKEPGILLENASDRLGLKIKTDVSILGANALEGFLFVNGNVDYDPKTAELFMTDPKVQAIEIDGLPDQYKERVEEILATAIEEYLSHLPFYQLKAEDTKQSLASLLLKSVYVKRGKLVVVLSLEKALESA